MFKNNDKGFHSVTPLPKLYMLKLKRIYFILEAPKATTKCH